LNARDKIKRLESNMFEGAQERQQTLAETHDRVRKRHDEQFQAEQAAFEEAPRPAVLTPAQSQELTQELQFDTNDHWWNKVPRLVKVEASLTVWQVRAKSVENEQLGCIIRGHQQLLADVPEHSGNLEEASSDGVIVAEQQDPETTDDHQQAMLILAAKEDSCDQKNRNRRVATFKKRHSVEVLNPDLCKPPKSECCDLDWIPFQSDFDDILRECCEADLITSAENRRFFGM
jgi:hypothetical protein